MKKLLNFSGRMGRKDYFLSFISITIIFTVIQFLFDSNKRMILDSFGQAGFMLVYSAIGLIALLCVIAQFSVTSKRLHDFNKTGLYGFLVIVPIVNLIFLIALLFIKGDVGPNNYDAVNEVKA